MKARHIDCYRVYGVVQAHLDADPERFGEINASGLRKEFDQIVAELGAHVVQQESLGHTTIGAEGLVQALRRDVIDCHIVPIVTFAAVIKPKVVNLPVVSSTIETDSTSLALSGLGLAAAVQPFQEHFIALGLKEDFVARLIEACHALRKAVTDRHMKDGRREGAIGGSAEAVAKANVCLRALSAMVNKTVRKDPEEVIRWKAARRLPSHGSKAGSVEGPDVRGQLARPTTLKAIARVSSPKLLPAGTPDEHEIEVQLVPSDPEVRPQGLLAGMRRFLPGR